MSPGAHDSIHVEPLTSLANPARAQDALRVRRALQNGAPVGRGPESPRGAPHIAIPCRSIPADRAVRKRTPQESEVATGVVAAPPESSRSGADLPSSGRLAEQAHAVSLCSDYRLDVPSRAVKDLVAAAYRLLTTRSFRDSAGNPADPESGALQGLLDAVAAVEGSGACHVVQCHDPITGDLAQLVQTAQATGRTTAADRARAGGGGYDRGPRVARASMTDYAGSVDRLSRDAILRALSALSEELARVNVRAELALAGGAALVLLFGARESTKDVDAFVLDASAQAAVASRRVAEVQSLPEDWLNDAAKGYVNGIALGETVFDSGALTVRAFAPNQLLAMKLSAWRDDVDVEDARVLLCALTGSREQIWSQVESHLVPGRELKARYAFDDLWEADRGSS
jgi:hypothetical protein